MMRRFAYFSYYAAADMLPYADYDAMMPLDADITLPLRCRYIFRLHVDAMFMSPRHMLPPPLTLFSC